MPRQASWPRNKPLGSLRGRLEVIAAAAIDRALRFVAVKLEPHRRGIGVICRHELHQPHVVVTKSRERDGLGAVDVRRATQSWT